MGTIRCRVSVVPVESRITMDNCTTSKIQALPGDILLDLPVNAVYWGRKYIDNLAEWIIWFKFRKELEKWTLGDLVTVSRDEALEASSGLSDLRKIEIIEKKLDIFGLKFGMTKEELELFRQGFKMDTFLGIHVGLLDWGSVRACNCMNALCRKEFNKSADKVMLGDMAMVDEKTFLGTKNLGVGTLSLIKDRFASLGLRIGMPGEELVAMCEEDAKRVNPDMSAGRDRNVMVKINPHDGPLPDNHGGKGDWYDLFAAEDVDMKVGEFRLISMGVSIEVPEGFTAYMLPRSSTFGRYGILQANSMGVIDSSYCGDEDIIRFPAFATRDVHISKGDRIAQLTVMPTSSITWIPVPTLAREARGGFGTTGK